MTFCNICHYYFMKSIYRKLHLWVSLPFGIFVFIICFTGALLVFEDEIYDATHRDMVFVEPVGDPLPLAQLLPPVVASLDEGVVMTGVEISEHSNRAYKVKLSKPKHAAIFVNQYTGEMLGQYGRTPFYMFVFKLHRWLLDSPGADKGVFWGRLIVGISTLAFVVIMVAGMLLWWPKKRKNVGKYLKIRGGSWATFWVTLHSAGGVYAFVVLMVCALTGLTWSFEWYRAGFYKLFGGDIQQTQQRGGGGKQEKTIDETYASWDEVHRSLQSELTSYDHLTISSGKVAVNTKGWGNQMAGDEYLFDATSGEVTKKILYADQPTNGKIRGWIHAVHFGAWGGLLTKIITFVAGLLGAALPLTGYYFWWRKLSRRRRHR